MREMHLQPLEPAVSGAARGVGEGLVDFFDFFDAQLLDR